MTDVVIATTVFLFIPFFSTVIRIISSSAVMIARNRIFLPISTSGTSTINNRSNATKIGISAFAPFVPAYKIISSMLNAISRIIPKLLSLSVMDT